MTVVQLVLTQNGLATMSVLRKHSHVMKSVQKNTIIARRKINAYKKTLFVVTNV